MNKDRSRAGWTILECMIIVTIIGIMALIAIPTWTAARNSSFKQVCKRNQTVIFEQMNIYCLERNLGCDVSTYIDIADVKLRLCNEALPQSERYIKRATAFVCPINPDQEAAADYRFVRDGNLINDIECDIDETHNED
jgi:Tfp pilus assembly protein PilE